MVAGISPQEVKMHFSFAVGGDKRRGRRFVAAVSLLQPGGGNPAAVKVKRVVYSRNPLNVLFAVLASLKGENQKEIFQAKIEYIAIKMHKMFDNI